MDATTAANAGIDLTQLLGVFFEEANEHLEAMEMLLVRIDPAHASDEDLNAIFRAAHSIKGGAATFGYHDVAEVTHFLESLLDKARRREIVLDAAMVDTLLASRDLVGRQIDAHRDGEPSDTAAVAAMCVRVRGHLEPPSAAASTLTRHTIEIRQGPDTPVPVQAVVEALAGLGAVTRLADADATAPASGKAKKGTRSRKAPAATLRFIVDTALGDVDLLSELAFIVPMDQMHIVGKATVPVEVAPPAPAMVATAPLSRPVAAYASAPTDDAGFGFFEPMPVPEADDAVAATAQPAAHETSVRTSERPSPVGETSIRVAVEKVDVLINLVGELVITQAMLAQNAAGLDAVKDERLLQGLMQLDRNTRALQEAVMSVRMTPIGVVFNRFPRVVRDLAARLEKDVHLEMEGEGTELDKGLIERLVDPLTHLVRNSLDHGIEIPATRVAQGKTATGTIRLRAFHRGGTVVIEVGDDGAGLDRTRILAKARERGMPAPDTMTDAEVWGLIFEAGFSTATEVTDVSGRGVGMDVVRRNVSEMGGSIDIQSVVNAGTTITIRLPLTLAIMDGMSVGVGTETYILPLASVVESLQVTEDQVRPVANRGLVAHVRNEYLPVISMHELFPTGGARCERASGIMVIVEIDKKKAALLVDELLGQHQVVVKSLDRNYRRVRGVSGATIMGDGRVAIILDVAALVRPRLS